MKKMIYMIVVAAVTMLLAGCSDFLDVQPEGSPTTTTYFANDAQAINAIKALYAPIYDSDGGYGREIYWEQCATNMMVPGRTRSYPGLFTLNYSGDEGPLSDTYNLFMGIIARANWVVKALLDKQAKTTLTPIEIRSLGEAYFVRGFLHFSLAYRYGSNRQGIPAIKYEEVEGEYDYSIPPQQATVMDNYAMIIADFEKAKEYLPRFETYGPDDRGRAHQAAAVAMMSRVYAYWATWDNTKWDNVISVVNELENSYGRRLADSFSNLFSADFKYWWGPEYCFTFPSNGGNDWKRGGVEWPGVILENKGWGVFNGWGQFKPTQDAYEEFAKDGEENNERLTRSILKYGQEFQFWGETRRFFSESDVETGFQINKWMDPFGYPDAINAGYVNNSGDWPTARVNFTVIRFADCMLLRAEANLAKGNNSEAAKDLNKIRARVNLPENCVGTWEELYHERFCELAYEPVADHLGDLKRWAVSSYPEIKALAIKELETHPRARHYSGYVTDPNTGESRFMDGYRGDPDGPYTIGAYLDFQSPAPKWEDHKICFPYPSNEITKAAGALKQNYGYN
ncbi:MULTISPECIES: RagB/SusD family nutrient uptake outer membrane protein [Petrimonas]|jgi:hypothetical protein|uniref:Putative outer membrane protein probably involved in nutrient binding n=1 Tax=Petrimonas mucosa TaxID=1642646 RepID=A0A1G4G583_9BACT|nr:MULTISPECIES: RagB/SusD family nutrient uptake outer membrane protein [Petrimonas]MDD3560799.1 RagB/SusD family nutrient uptake outer membrane protein [Petrimonas mucosa]SCM56408.1 putative outer membrane protein probably involved in nutrient binding {ECO:0000313/EMBL:CDD32918,1} [Petrimonas mucosa]HHT29272.1 RagB/SusD family nutrient uptake outer membrane protein [Petrimonas mucosa]